MKCRNVRKMLADYSDDVLEPKERRRVQEHIAGCKVCRREMDMLRTVLELVDNAEIEYPPASVWENFLPDLHRRIENEAALVFAEQQRQRFYLFPGWAATAAIVLLLFVSVVMRERPLIRSVPTQKVTRGIAIGDTALAMPVVGIISDVLITEAEAEKLRELESASQLEISTFPYYYRYYSDDALTETSSDVSTTPDREAVIQYLENEFAEFHASPMLEPDDADFGSI